MPIPLKKWLSESSTQKIIGTNLFIVGLITTGIAGAMLRGFRVLDFLWSFPAMLVVWNLWASVRELMQRQKRQETKSHDNDGDV